MDRARLTRFMEIGEEIIAHFLHRSIRARRTDEGPAGPLQQFVQLLNHGSQGS